MNLLKYIKIINKLTITKDHAGHDARIRRDEGTGNARGPLVHVEEMPHAVARAVRVVQPHVPQRFTS